jgi:hypothetical protein
MKSANIYLMPFVRGISAEKKFNGRRCHFCDFSGKGDIATSGQVVIAWFFGTIGGHV